MPRDTYWVSQIYPMDGGQSGSIFTAYILILDNLISSYKCKIFSNSLQGYILGRFYNITGGKT